MSVCSINFKDIEKIDFIITKGMKKATVKSK